MRLLGWLSKSESQMILLTLGILVVAITTITFSYYENERAEKEFELRIRPYLTLEIEKMNDNWYDIKIKNQGIIPAKIISREESLTEVETGIKISRPKGSLDSIVGQGEEIKFGEVFKNETAKKNLEIFFKITYISAIEENLKENKEYSSQVTFIHQPGKDLELIPKMALT